MDKRSNQLTSSQLMWFIISVQVGIGIITLPNDLAIACGHDGWISVAAFGILIAIAVAIIVKLMNRYNNQSIYGINKFLFGKYIGGTFNLLIVLYLWYSACLYLRVFINILHILVLRLTPSLILSFFIIIPTFYLTWYGLKYVARFTILIVVCLSFCFLLFILSSRYFRFTLLMPVAQSDISSLIGGFNYCMYAFLGYEIITVIYPEITNKKKVMKYSILAITITTIFYITLLIVTDIFFGEVFLKGIMYPIFKLSRSYEAPIIERIDLIFMCIWFPAMAMATRGYFFTAYYSINKLFNLKKNIIFLIGFTVTTILLSRIPKSNSNLFAYKQFMITSGTAFTVFLILCYIFSFLRKKGVSSK